MYCRRMRAMKSYKKTCIPALFPGRGGARNGGIGSFRDAQTPRQASCLLRSHTREVSFSPLPVCSSLFHQHRNSQRGVSLQYKLVYLINLGYNLLCLITFFHPSLNCLDDCELDTVLRNHSGSSAIRKRSFAMLEKAQLKEFCNNRGVLQLASEAL